MTSVSVASLLVFFFIMEVCVYAYEVPMFLDRGGLVNFPHHSIFPRPFYQSPSLSTLCYYNSLWINCPILSSAFYVNPLVSSGVAQTRFLRQLSRTRSESSTENGHAIINTEETIMQQEFRRFMSHKVPAENNIPSLKGTISGINLGVQSGTSNPTELSVHSQPVLNLKLDSVISKPMSVQDLRESTTARVAEFGDSQLEEWRPKNNVPAVDSLYNHFLEGLDQLERQFYMITFKKLSSISPANRRENGISFVQSGLFLQLALTALSTEVDFSSRREIEDCLKLNASPVDKIELIRHTLVTLPLSGEDLRFRWSTRLALWPGRDVSRQFHAGAASALQLHLDRFNGTETPEKIAHTLNRMVEIDSGGAIHDTFQEEELSEGVQAVLLTTIYLRARWRSAPTVLNGTRPFRDVGPQRPRAVRCIRINDIMRYAQLTEWDAEAIEIFYATPGLSLLILVPREASLSRLAEHVAGTRLRDITQRMRATRIAATLPLYTLRMTLLLPNKLQAMGISELVNTTSSSWSLSHAVQRIMFWAEAGRNAYKDDGIEWDETPELELVVDRPYIFFVRWRNITIMNGNFVL